MNLHLLKTQQKASSNSEHLDEFPSNFVSPNVLKNVDIYYAHIIKRMF